ncbi:MAG: superoxide dismutase [Gammaproteobacteria bacterium]|nr:superoxide dismutase [Gammaproteobacteria bacterium]
MTQHILPKLPYAFNALEPYISAETLEYHYGKHHASYVDKLNKQIIGTEFENVPLEDIIKRASGGIFNNGAQVWNHTFYWNCMTPHASGEPGKDLATAIDDAFSSFDKFKEKFTESATSNFGSGWTWLVRNLESGLEIVNTSNAENPMTDGKYPLLVCDVWEHAYYIDYRNARADYIKAFWKLVNWEFVAQNLELTSQAPPQRLRNASSA